VHVHLAASQGFSFADEYALGLIFAAIALFAAVGALSHQDERAFSAAVVYLLLGAGAALALTVAGVDLLDPLEDHSLIEHLAEFAVIVAIFSAGLKLDRAVTWRGWRSVTMLLAVAMPLTIIAIALFGTQVMGLSLGAAIVLGAVLAPTDPVLAGDVQVGPPGEGDEPEPKFALTAEAGLNDGLAFPFVFLGILVAGEGGTGWVTEWLAADVLYSIVVGLLVGALGGRGVAALVLNLRERELLLKEFDGWLAIATLVGIYGVTEVLGAYGFVAVFAGGLSFRRYEAHHEYIASVHGGVHAVEKFSELALLLVLGSTVTLAGLAEPGLSGWMLAPVLLLAIRPLAVVVALARSPLPPTDRAFIGFFGIRGIGSFYYVAVAIGSGAMSAGEASIVYWTVLVCVGVSIIVHGITATPATRRLMGERPGR
jgi:sodium/hydrogen antiporter